MLRSLHRQPIHDFPNGDTPPFALGPQQAQPKTKRADPAPCAHDIPVLALLKLRDAWAVVAHHAIDRAILERLPQLFPIGLLTDGRAALELRAPIRDLLVREHEVVEACLDGERQAGGLGGADKREGGGGGEVDDVQPEGGVLDVQRGDELDGIDFERLRAGGEEGVRAGQEVVEGGTEGVR